MQIEPFIITQNHQIISNVLIALFYSNNLDDILLNTKNINININKDRELDLERYRDNNLKLLYFQEILKTSFIDLVRRSKSVFDLEDINIMSKKLNDRDNITVITYTELLLKLFNVTPIITKNSNIYKIIILLDDKHAEKSINGLIYNYLATNNITNVPKILTIALQRQKTSSKIDIQKRLKINDNVWIFHSLICKDSNNNLYSLINFNDYYYIFNANNTPCLSINKIDMNNNLISDKIKSVLFLVIYRILN